MYVAFLVVLHPGQQDNGHCPSIFIRHCVIETISFLLQHTYFYDASRDVHEVGKAIIARGTEAVITVNERR